MGVVPTELEKSTWRIKIRYISLELYHVNTKISIFAAGTGESAPPFFFCKLWNTIYREIINIMTIMMKTIKKTFESLYNKYIDGLGSCLFLEFTFVFFTSNIQSP